MVAPQTGAPEIAVAEDQLEYKSITVARYGDNAGMGPVTLLTRWRLTDGERARVAAGEDVYVALRTFGDAMQPIVVQVGPEGW
jgi:hypothetical protein